MTENVFLVYSLGADLETGPGGVWEAGRIPGGDQDSGAARLSGQSEPHVIGYDAFDLLEKFGNVGGNFNEPKKLANR